MLKKVSLIIVVTFALSSTLVTGASPYLEVDGLDELTKKKGLFKTTLVHPDADFSRYDTLYLSTVMLQFRETVGGEAEPTTGSKIGKRGSSTSIPDREDVARLRQTIDEAFSHELGNSEAYELVNEPDRDTLILKVSFVDVISKIPPKSSSRYGERVSLIAKGMIVCDLIDAETGLIQARVGERTAIRRADDEEEPEGGATLWTDIFGWAHTTAADLREELETVRVEDEAGQVGDAT